MPKTKKEWLALIGKTLLVILGTVIVALGNVAFLVPLDVNAGGLNGVGIIARVFIEDPGMKILVYNIIITAASVLLWLVGLIFVGKDFAIKTLVATIVFPGANWLFTSCPGISDALVKFGELIRDAANGPTAGNFLMAGIFGGVLVGLGVAITFIGGGSTGGVDILTFLLEKYLKIRQSISSFIVDTTIILAGLITFLIKDPSYLMPCLSGVVSAFITAMVIEVVYIGSQTSYQADVISDKWEEISAFAQNELGRGATIIPAKGGYKGEERVVLRIIFDKSQYNKIRSFISKIDKKAFVTYTRTNAVYGEGFKSHTKEHLFSKKDKKDGTK